jgi:hypothetical protein
VSSDEDLASDGSAILRHGKQFSRPSLEKVSTIVGILGGVCGIVALLWQIQESRIGRAEIVVAEPAPPLVDDSGSLKLRFDLTNLGERTVYIRSLSLMKAAAEDRSRPDSGDEPLRIAFAGDTSVAIEPGGFVRFTGPPMDLFQVLEWELANPTLRYRTTRKPFKWRLTNLLRDDAGVMLQQVVRGELGWASTTAAQHPGLTTRLFAECKAASVPADEPDELARRGLINLWVVRGRGNSASTFDLAFALSDSLKARWSPRQQICWLVNNTIKGKGAVRVFGAPPFEHPWPPAEGAQVHVERGR